MEAGAAIPRAAGPASAGRGTASVGAALAAQLRADLKVFWRNPASRYFTIALPIVFLVIFDGVFGGSAKLASGQTINSTTYYVPGIMTLSIVSAAFVNLTVSLVTQRELGVLKRVRGTPVPAAVVIASRAAVSIVIALSMAVLLVAIGRVFYSVPVPNAVPALVLGVVVGAAAFCCVGFALSSLIKSADAAPPMVNFIVLPLYFISGVFVPDGRLPSWLRGVANVFPVRHLSQALLAPYTHGHGSAIAGKDLLVLVAWGVGALLFALRCFRWTPQSD